MIHDLDPLGPVALISFFSENMQLVNCISRRLFLMQIRSVTTRPRTITASSTNRSLKAETTSLTSLLELPHNQALQASLSREAGSPLASVSNLILGMKELRINSVILHLNVKTVDSFQMNTRPKYKEIKEMKKKGLVVIGKYNKPKTEMIKARYQQLITEAEVDQENLASELFPTESSPNHKLKRNLVGFYLLQDLPDGHLRLPVDVVAQLGYLLMGGKFSKAEDAVILAWVEERGATDWTQLAHSLGRRNQNADGIVLNRYLTLEAKNKGGEFDVEEIVVILRGILEQKPNALRESSGISWIPVAGRLNRNYRVIRNLFVIVIQPTILRYYAGTLEKDVRLLMIQHVKKEGWQYGIDVDFKLLASQPGFEGHTHASLGHLYAGLQMNAMRRTGLESMKEVTVEQVEEYWSNTERREKNKRVIAREQGILEAYHRVVDDLNLKNEL